MKILITGAGGQLGQTLSKKTADLHETVVLDRRSLDITNLPDVEKIIEETKPECVINAAAYTAVDKAETETELAFEINRDGPKNLAIVCAKFDIPLIHVSTDYVFNGEKSSPYVETDEICPINVYGESKWQGEEAVRTACDKHIILRVSWVFGLYGHNFVKTIQRLARELEEFKIVADQQGCPTATENISRVILRIVDKFSDNDFSNYGTYHYCDSPATNWCEFAKVITEETSVYEDLMVKNILPNTTAGYPTPAARPQNSRMDCSKLQRDFGIEQYAWRDALKKMIKDLHES